MAEAWGYDPATTQEKARLGFAKSQSRSEPATQLAGLGTRSSCAVVATEWAIR